MKPGLSELRRRYIRNLLRTNRDGLTVTSIIKILATTPPFDQVSISDRTIRDDLETMVDAYVDRWAPNNTSNTWAAIWCVVVPPENCPRPEGSPCRMSS